MGNCSNPILHLSLSCCLYSMSLCRTFIRINKKVETYNWIDTLDSWVFNLKNKWL